MIVPTGIESDAIDFVGWNTLDGYQIPEIQLLY